MRSKKTLIAAVTAALLAGGGAVAASALTGDDSPPPARESDLPQATAAVEQSTLTSTSTAKGTLGYSSERKINAGGQGVLTWRPKTGTDIKRDGRLYELNGGPVHLLYGSRPMYRELKQGSEGEDVRQLKQNLIALGHGSGLTADDEFTAGTAKGVKAWQKAHGLKQTGRVGPSQIAFAPGAVRLQSAEASVGELLSPGRPVLTATGAERQVTFDLKVEDAAGTKPGDEVSVDLPDGSRASGEITSVGKTASGGGGGEPGGSGEDEPKVKVAVDLDDADKVEGVDKAPVTVHLKGESAKNALHVPVESLLADPSGGFAVQVVEGGKARDVKVELGLFANGRVEVTGGGLKAGMKVGVPKT
ncbi:peptidoglycan-binding protein [Streptomyces boninensis]|uniref:peptidoglycan-binding protein n=1 Tax=Streptomyces boninensis TaxID=2039455 RepID=UPI003B20D191